MTKKNKAKQSFAAPADNYVQHWRSMYDSPAFRALSHMARRVLACLEREHLRHGGKDNGRLICTYATLMEYCDTKDRPAVTRAIFELRDLGFLKIKPGKACRFGDHSPNEYTLTHISIDKDHPATNEWAKIQSFEEAKQIVKGFRRKRGQSDWIKTASETGELRSGLKSKKNTRLPQKSVAVATPASMEIHTRASSHVPTRAGMDFHTRASMDSAYSPSSHVANTYLDAIHILAPERGPGLGAPGVEADSPAEANAPATENPKPASANGNSEIGHRQRQPAMESAEPQTDTEWFRKNPRRRYRLRKPEPGEANRLGFAFSQELRLMVEKGDKETMECFPGHLPLDDSDEAIAEQISACRQRPGREP